MGRVMHCHSVKEGNGLHTTGEGLVCSHLLRCLAEARKSSFCSVLQSILCHGFARARTCCPSQKHRGQFLEAAVGEESGGGRSKDAVLQWEMGAQDRV